MRIQYSDYFKEALELYTSQDNRSATQVAKILYDKYNPAVSFQSFRRTISNGIKKRVVLNVDVKSDSKTAANNYKKPKFVLSAWNKESGKIMNLNEYCDFHNLPREDITSYKLITHTSVPFYNIVFKENKTDVSEIDFDVILSRYENFKPLERVDPDILQIESDFDMLTYTDVHIGMDTDSTGNSMYAEDWSADSIMRDGAAMVQRLTTSKRSNTVVVDELGDFLDGFNGFTTRGGHKLPQLMTNEEAFDVALQFKINMVDQLSSVYDHVILNNICNDNHAGSFGYFVNSALQKFCARVFDNVDVVNHRKFLNHYFIGDVCFIVSHGKDDSTLKFGFKPFLDSKGIEKIDQYCKRNEVYKRAKKIVFKKGDSHQCLFDMCTSDDFYYFNYPALSPSSQWVQNNFKKGRRGYTIEKWTGLNVSIDPVFL